MPNISERLSPAQPTASLHILHEQVYKKAFAPHNTFQSVVTAVVVQPSSQPHLQCLPCCEGHQGHSPCYCHPVAVRLIQCSRRCSSLNKPFKAFMPGAVAHQGGGWVQLFKGSEDAVCILSPSVSPWMASFWLLPSWAAVFRPFYPPAHPSSWLLLGLWFFGLVLRVCGCPVV
jgi:hypothetical protein